MKFAAGTNVLRRRGADEHSKVIFVELFFDLVFVFAITQLSHTLLEQPTSQGLMQATLLLTNAVTNK